MDERGHTDPCFISGIATAEDGLVFLDGPNGVAIALTAQAAAETGRSLIEASEKALSQIERKR